VTQQLPERPTEPTQSEYAAQLEGTTDTGRSRSRRLVGALAAGALVVGTAGAAVAVATHDDAGGSAGAAPRSSANQAPSYDWWSSGGQAGAAPSGPGGSLGGDPFGGDPLGGGSSGTQGGWPSDGGYGGQGVTQATADQVAGLVRIDSQLADGEAAGTGMVLTSDGEVVTNNHVVAGAYAVEVTVMSTGQSYEAQVVGTDPTDDVAVLQVAGASGLSTVSIDHDGVSVGDDVTAVGDAGGTTSYLSASTGAVTALDQSITTESEGAALGERLTGLIEIDADVMAGDSGGATLDSDGEVVGMTTAASSGSPNVTGYAIPIAKALDITDQIESGSDSGNVRSGATAFLGVELDPSSGGATIGGVVDGSPAAEAGLAAGDTLTSVDGAQVSTGDDLRSAILAHEPGDSVQVTWVDPTGTTHSAGVTLTQGPAQ
jgi:S1-C subfamily serine protease